MKQLEGWMVCRKCEFTLPESNFRPNKNMRSGLSSWCRRCHVEATKEWRARKRQEKLEAQRERSRLHWERTHASMDEWKRRQAIALQNHRGRMEGLA